MNTSDYVIIFMKILGSLALLIYGMKVMSEALQECSQVFSSPAPCNPLPPPR